MCGVHMVTYWLMWIGAVNWGLIGAFDFNLVNAILGSVPMVERIVYIVVGLSALFMLTKGMCKGCKACCGGACKNEPGAPAAGGAKPMGGM
ncbi:DUF378 domain-containing protein [Patescibacteria group bacterium]|nr:MAG: DUF378 domain-containing protein [Patescibacteria group bacterium]